MGGSTLIPPGRGTCLKGETLLVIQGSHFPLEPNNRTAVICGWASPRRSSPRKELKSANDEPLSTDRSRLPADRGAGRRKFPLGEPADAGARRRRDSGSRPLSFARSVHARPHERRQVLCQAG